RVRTGTALQASHPDRLGGGGAELAGGEDVATLHGDVLARRHRRGLDRRTELAEHRAASEQHGRDARNQCAQQRTGAHRATSTAPVPGTPSRIVRENTAEPASGGSAVARGLM